MPRCLVPRAFFPISHFPSPRSDAVRSPMPPSATLRLRALEGIPMDDPVVRDTVIATAHAIAERFGVNVLSLSTDSNSITVTLEIDTLAAIGFMAELRRLTNAWYERKFKDGPLWGTAEREEGEEGYFEGFE